MLQVQIKLLDEAISNLGENAAPKYIDLNYTPPETEDKKGSTDDLDQNAKPRPVSLVV